MRLHAWWAGVSCLALVMLASPQASGQRDLSPEQLREEAMTAFDDEQWDLAHRRMAELLSLDGTDVFLQMRYAATLLHDARMRDEGIQRLASLADAGDLSGEGWLWWGRAWMLQGEPQLAESALLKAQEEAGKKASWLADCELALAQARALPTEFESKQSLQQLDAVDVPEASFFRYVQWAPEGVRIMLAPQDVMSKLDKKSNVSSPVTFWRGERELFFHSLGSKGSQGLDLHVAMLDSDGAFAETAPLPSHVNSPWDEVHPVWDPSSECLIFASNRPGTVGGFDLFRSCRQAGVWTAPESLGPMFNSVHDDLAYYPADGDLSGWLVTGREAAYGGIEVWEVQLNGEPQIPVHLNTKWQVDGEVVPGTLRLSDAQTDEPLAEVQLEEARGQWNLVVGAGQVLRYAFETNDGQVIEGTYAVPSANEPSAVAQTMVMSVTDGAPFLEAKPLTQEATPSPDLAWGWGLALDAIHEIEVEAWAPEEAEPMVANHEDDKPARRVVQFKSYPWWTEVQKEERAIAASLLSKYVVGEEMELPRAEEFGQLSEYQGALQGAQEALMDEAVTAITAVASKDIILNETPWEEALSAAVMRASSKWPVGTLNVEEVARKAKRLWAQSGSLYDQGVLPDVRDKQGLVGDGTWIEEPWVNGRVQGLASEWKEIHRMAPEAVKLAWTIAQNPALTTEWDAKWFTPAMWDAEEVRRAVTLGSEEAQMRDLEAIRTRLAILERMEPSVHWTEEEHLQAIRLWKGVAVSAAAGKAPAEAEAQASSEVVASEDGRLSGSLDEAWRSIWMAESPLRAARHAGADSHTDSHTDSRTDAVTESQRVTEASGPKGQDTNYNEESEAWRAELVLWLKERADEGLVMRPDVVVAEAARVVQEKSAFEWGEGLDDEPIGRPDAEATARLDAEGIRTMNQAKSELLSELVARAIDVSDVEDAWQTLEATWVVSHWLTHPDWENRSPDQIEALLPFWPKSAQVRLEELRIAWAKSVQEQPRKGLEVEASAQEETEGGIDGFEEPDRGQAALEVGTRGVHLGWFRSEPRLSSLPSGTSLASEQGTNNLTRWVLVISNDAMVSEVDDIETWLMKQGVLDAFEVFRGSDGSTTEKPSSSGGATDIARPVSTAHTAAKEDTEPEPERDAESTSSAPADEDALTTSETSEASNADWGSDDMWSHGAPVALGNLRGTWYAVQVGAFRGLPKKEWIEQAGERLIYEPFPDGLARWYAGVRQDKNASTSRKEELQLFEAFADAFVVRLRDGVREVIRPGMDENDDLPVAQDADNASESPAAIERTDGKLSGVSVAETVQENASENKSENVPEAQASPALVASSVSTSASVTMWHIDIAKYYGTVPSQDVATLLFKAADWGVRSVQLFGQTTYFTRSFDDLGEAERLLEGIQSEGFLNATLVEE